MLEFHNVALNILNSKYIFLLIGSKMTWMYLWSWADGSSCKQFVLKFEASLAFLFFFLETSQKLLLKILESKFPHRIFLIKLIEFEQIRLYNNTFLVLTNFESETIKLRSSTANSSWEFFLKGFLFFASLPIILTMIHSDSHCDC